MPFLRWLLPVIAVLALLGSSVTSWASAGVIGDDDCCCPIKAKCKCHDHDRAPEPAAKLKKCGDVVKLVAPVQLIAIAPAPIAPAGEPRVVPARAPDLAPMPDDRSERPETPPF